MVYIFLSIAGKSKYIIIYVSNLHCIHLSSNYTGSDDFSGDCVRIFLAQMPAHVLLLLSVSRVNTQQITASEQNIPNIDFTVIYKYANELSVCL